jgi:5'(3')-deoxyribonucleotidase
MPQLHGKKILYINMDGVLADLGHAIAHVDPAVRAQHAENPDEIPGIFADLKPMPGALDAFRKLSAAYHTYILSTAPWKNPGAWQDKLDWVQKHLGDVGYKRLIITPDHHLSKGDYLIDDQPRNAVKFFEGTHIQLGSPEYPDWAAVLRKLLP